MGSAGAGDLSADHLPGEPGIVWAVLRAEGACAEGSDCVVPGLGCARGRAGDVAKNLSGGMKRRLNMAAGMMHRPKVVLFDEPTVGVDPQSRNRIFEMIEALRDEGMAIIYTTHYMEEAERLCDRVAIIDHGRIIARARRTSWCEGTFGSRSQVLARFAGGEDAIEAWAAAARRAGGGCDGGVHDRAGDGDCGAAGGCDEGGVGAGGCVAAQAESGVGVSAPDGKGATRLILNVARTALIALRRDRGALVLSFVLPVVFFTYFCGDFRQGERLDTEGQVDCCG